MGNNLGSSVQYLKGVGPARANQLKRLGVETVRDLLLHFPNRYEDRRHVVPIADIREGDAVTVRGRVVRVQDRRIRKGRLLQAVISDETGTLTATWFKDYGFKKKLGDAEEVVLHGKVTAFRHELQITHPDFEIVEPGADPTSAALGGIVPFYPLTEGLAANTLRPIVHHALAQHAGEFREWLPRRILDARKLPDIVDSLRKIHTPDDPEEAAAARRRFAYEELFLMQLVLAGRRRGVRAAPKGIRFRLWPELHDRIRSRIPFRLTGAQERVIGEILKDMAAEKAMNRLLQGDVGSGKTIVAVYAMLAAVANQAQVALMAPTEILAEQHWITLRNLLEGARIKLLYLGGGLGAKARKAALKELSDGTADIVVGTHALIQEGVAFERLGLVVVDEQHKFGVSQRAALRRKGEHPDVLVMTATPIPRTLTLTLFGDLDVSTIDEMPPGRNPPRTRWIRNAPQWNEAVRMIRGEIRKGRQAFFVYPLIEDSQDLDLKSLESHVDVLRGRWFPDFRLDVIHGRMRRDQREAAMRRFRQGDFELLAATTVIEVGIDVPNASIMVVEEAHRFGLAQLHQLRGRIGRGGGEAFCFLRAGRSTPEAHHRLTVMENSCDGFRIAEEDLALRGPGEFFGTRQHGLPELKAADLIRDTEILKQAREDAFRVVLADPRLNDEEHVPIKRTLQERYRGRIGLIDVG